MPEGYPRLASLMGAHAETAIFRRFGSLNALNLLYMQAELISLENVLKKQVEADVESKEFERSLYTRDWQTFSESAESKDGDPSQWNTVLKLKEKLNEYNQALVLQHVVTKIGAPNKQDFKFLQTWMQSPSMGNVYLLGADSDAWENFDAAELKPELSDIYGNTVYYSQEGITRVSAVVGTTIASLLLVGSIVVLYLVGSMTTRLIAIGVFTAFFALASGLLTNGRMVEIFSATAAFAAVQVVFIGSTS